MGTLSAPTSCLLLALAHMLLVPEPWYVDKRFRFPRGTATFEMPGAGIMSALKAGAAGEACGAAAGAAGAARPGRGRVETEGAVE